MRLAEYRRKRDFRVTAEPRGGKVVPHSRLRFVIQKHAASHLHYDFRLELDGVLKSWAVPKGPSLDPATKRLAMHVEDHPLEYGDFEGIIPQGEYGGGTVLLWDEGTWEPVDDARKAYRDGSLKFVLQGKKLEGRWMLVRKGGKRGDPAERSWFLFKERDEFAKPTVDITSTMPLSVTTGRDLDQIATQANRVWGPNGEVEGNGRATRKRSATTNSRKNADDTKLRHSQRSAGRNGDGTAAKAKVKQPVHRKNVSAADPTAISKTLKRLGGKQSSLPKNTAVQLATLTKEPPAGNDWLHEIKLDGYRMLCRIEQGTVRFISRNGNDWTRKFPALVDAAKRLPIMSGMIDGEVVVVQPDGTTSFQALQNAFETKGVPPFVFYVFDILYLNGHDVREAPIEDRKALLRLVVGDSVEGPVRYSDHVVGNGAMFFAEAARLHLEGIISKRVGCPYTSGRGLDWLKVKCSLREEFVIGGFTAPGGGRTHFGALLLGYYDLKRNFIYAGRVGTGFDDRTLKTLHAKFMKLVQKRSPFADLSGTTGKARGVTWLKPTLVAQIEFSNWTNERQLRHPSFQGLREDKDATEVVRDAPVALPATETEIPAPKRGRAKTRYVPKAVASARVAAHAPAESSDVAGVHLSHPDKVLYPDDGITKLDLAHYYEEVASRMLPYVEGRLLSLVRCPGGSGNKCFFQKHPGEAMSEHFQRIKVSEKQKVEEHLAIYDLAGLIALVQMGVLEIHIWGSRADQFEKPDRLVFDLDPDPTVDWPHVVTAAREVRVVLEELGLRSFLKTTGGKGLHIIVPIQRRITWKDAKAFCRAVANFLVAAAPDRYIATMSKAARKGKIFVDYLRNDRGATSIAPYSTRARAGATVSVPIDWDELSTKLKSDSFTIRNVPARLSRMKKDPWADMAKTSQVITASMVRQLNIR